LHDLQRAKSRAARRARPAPLGALAVAMGGLALARMVNVTGPQDAVLAVLPLLAALGMLSGRRWGAYLFIVAALIMLLGNLLDSLRGSGRLPWLSASETLVVFVTAVYLLQKDSFLPYFSDARRGWRLGVRRALHCPVRVDGLLFVTRDVSAGGLYIRWPDCDRSIGSEVELQLSLSAETLRLAGVIVRVDERGAGVRFVRMERRTAGRLRVALGRVQAAQLAAAPLRA
jgi:hypothetical protein